MCPPIAYSNVHPTFKKGEIYFIEGILETLQEMFNIRSKDKLKKTKLWLYLQKYTK